MWMRLQSDGLIRQNLIVPMTRAGVFYKRCLMAPALKDWPPLLCIHNLALVTTARPVTSSIQSLVPYLPGAEKLAVLYK